MAITTIYTYPLTGSQREFTVPFEYLARRFVVLTLIGQDRKELVLATDFRFISKTTVQTTVAWGPADGYERIEIRRDTSATDRLVDFADGSILRASELNISQIQTLHVAEEARNMVADTIAENADGDLDARGRRLVNLADAQEPDHAVTLRQEQAWSQSTLGNRNASEAAKVAAQQAQQASEAARDTSISKASESAASAAASQTSRLASEAARDTSISKASESAASAAASQTSRLASEAARDTSISKASESAASAAASAASAASINLPSLVGKAGKYPQVKPDESGYQLVDVITQAQVQAMLDLLLPAGLMAPFAMQVAPSGWLWMNGDAVSRTGQARLFAAIGTTYGSGDGSTTFNLPDMRGSVAEAWDDRVSTSSTDASYALGTLTSGSATITNLALPDGSIPKPGMAITGVGIPVGTTVVSHTPGATTLVMSAAATASKAFASYGGDWITIYGRTFGSKQKGSMGHFWGWVGSTVAYGSGGIGYHAAGRPGVGGGGSGLSDAALDSARQLTPAPRQRVDNIATLWCIKA